MRDRDCYLLKARKSGSNLDWSTYKTLKNNITGKIRYAKAAILIEENVNNPRKFWKLLQNHQGVLWVQLLKKQIILIFKTKLRDFYRS